MSEESKIRILKLSVPLFNLLKEKLYDTFLNTYMDIDTDGLIEDFHKAEEYWKAFKFQNPNADPNQISQEIFNIRMDIEFLKLIKKIHPEVEKFRNCGPELIQEIKNSFRFSSAILKK